MILIRMCWYKKINLKNLKNIISIYFQTKNTLKNNHYLNKSFTRKWKMKIALV